MILLLGEVGFIYFVFLGWDRVGLRRWGKYGCGWGGLEVIYVSLYMLDIVRVFVGYFSGGVKGLEFRFSCFSFGFSFIVLVSFRVLILEVI